MVMNYVKILSKSSYCICSTFRYVCFVVFKLFWLVFPTLLHKKNVNHFTICTLITDNLL